MRTASQDIFQCAFLWAWLRRLCRDANLDSSTEGFGSFSCQVHEAVPCYSECNQYSWEVGPWSPCEINSEQNSLHCGEGIQTRKVRCVKTKAQVFQMRKSWCVLAQSCNIWTPDSECVAESSVFQMKRNVFMCHGFQWKHFRDAALVFQEHGMIFKLVFFSLNAMYT